MAVDKAEELLYSPLTRLDEKAYEPELYSYRIGYIERMNKGDHTDMTELELSAVAKLYPWPKGVKLRLPCEGGGSQGSYRGYIVIYEEALKAGFRLPLHPLISKFLSEINLCPSQLTPNSWRCLLAFLLKCKELGRVPSYDALKNIFAVKSIEHHSVCYDIYFPTVSLITNPPSNDASWRNRWFLVSGSGEFDFNFRRFPGSLQKIVDFSCSTETLKFIETLKRLPHPGPDYNEVLDPYRLEEAGLSLAHPITGECNEHILNSKREVGCSSVEPQQIDRPRKKAKTCISQQVEVEFDDEPHVIVLDDDVEPEEDAVRDSEGTSAIDVLCHPEFIAAVQQLPDILKAVKQSEELQRQLDENEQENVVLKREKTELISQHEKFKRREKELVDEFARKERNFQLRIKRMEIEKKSVEKELRATQSKLMKTTQKAKELFEISSSPLNTKQ